MPSPRSLSIALVALCVIAITPSAAHAITVECTLKDGSSCTVSNDPVDSTSCMCADESGTGTSGANDWADFDEAMLLEVCTSELELCSVAGTDGATTGMGTIGTDSTDTVGDTGGGGTSTSPGGTTGWDASSSEGGVTGDITGASGGSGPSTDPAATTGGSASGGDVTTTGSEPASSGESSGGSEATNEDPSGCSVDARGRSPGALLALLGLVLGLRRRPR